MDQRRCRCYLSDGLTQDLAQDLTVDCILSRSAFAPTPLLIPKRKPLDFFLSTRLCGRPAPTASRGPKRKSRLG